MNNRTPIPYQFILGLLLAITAGALMFFGIGPVAARITILIVGLLLIAGSKYRLL